MIDPEITAIEAAMKQQGKTKADLTRLLGLDSSQVTRMFGGRRRLQLHEAKAIHAWLGAEPKTAELGGTITPMPGMVPLYGWNGGASEGLLSISEQSLRGYVPMHPNQAHTRNAFALEVADVGMVPRYEPGEIIYCSPNRWPARGQDCVLMTNSGEGLLKRFVSRDAETLFLHQLNPDLGLKYPMSTVAAVHAVVGRG